MTINFNVEPYYDDYSDNKKFHRILFRPGYAVQARELTQLQTILQKQIERFGNHLFKDGTMVIPGQVSFDTKLAYVKLNNRYGTTDVSSYVENLIGYVVEGQTTGVRAQIVQATKASGSDPAMLFVKYVSNGAADELGVETGAQREFLADEILTTLVNNGEVEYSVQIQSTNTSSNPAFGESSAASISKGVYYIKGFFVLVDDQTVITDKYSKSPTSKIGLKIVESLIEPEDDETLLDNAQSSYNYSAPGAHRYAIDAQLIKRSIDSTETDDFIELLRVVNGKVQYIVNKTTYAVLEDNLARRTYDESGNYTVRPFGIDVREYRDNNRLSWNASTAYLVDDIIKYEDKFYVAKKSGVSLNVSNPTLDTAIGWEEVSSPKFNRGIYPAPSTVKKAVLDSNGEPTFNYDENGRIVSQIFTTQPATVADHEQLEAKLAIGIESGKAYVFGYEIEKFGTTYVEVEKSRETEIEENALFSADYGNYVLVNNINFAPNISALPEVDIYNAYTTSLGSIPSGINVSKVGTARIRGMEWHSGDSSGPGAYYKLFLFDINMFSIPGNATGERYGFNTHAKQFRIAGPSTASSFTADAAVLPEQQSGSITFASASPTTTIIGVNTKFLNEFSVGEFIFLADAPRQITSIVDNLSMTVSTAVPSQSGASVLKCTSLLVESTKSSLVFPLPQYAIKTVSDVSYYTSNVYNATASAAVGSTCQIIITTSGNNEFANPNNFGNYTLFSRSTGETVTPISAVRSADNLSITFTVGSQYSSTLFLIYATIQKERALGLKSKVVTSDTVTRTTAASVNAKTIYLGKADGVRLKSVKMQAGKFGTSSGTYTIDITSRYSFNGGQTESYYGVSSITLKDGQAVPVAPIQIEYEYFNHSAGDFFTVDSYSNYKEIPYFNKFNLRDCIDFRPRVDDSITGDVVFTGGNDLLPKFGQDLILSYEYYLSRKSKIAVNKYGDFTVVNGAAHLNPVEPSDPTDGMVIYKLELEPFTFKTDSSSVAITPIENKRYTMRDIGRIEQRVNQLEYYTSLSLLEQETNSLSIKDEDGLDRLKNGFIVDNFTSQFIGDTSSSDYMCSVDMQNGVLRPFYSMTNVDFVETHTNNTDRAAAGVNYQLTGDVITLPYTNVSLVSQPFASTTENINPFAIFTFIGTANITPPFDRWFEVDRRPDIIVTSEGNFNAIKTLAEKAGVLGSVWNAWQTQWTGAPTTTRVTSTRRNNQGVRTVVTQVTATNIGQSRTGIKTSIQESIERKTVEDKVLSVATIPYIRSRNILVQAKGLKPNTIFYPYFDKISIGQYCDPADKLVIDKTGFNTIEFNESTGAEPLVNSGNDYKNSARAIGPNPDLALNIGDIVYVSKRGSTTYTLANSPTTAIVVGRETKIQNGVIVERSIDIANVKNSVTSNSVGFVAGDEIVGSISGATAKVTLHTVKSVGSTLITNNNGDVNFLFNIPNDDSVRFRSGKKELTLLTNSDYDLITSASSLTEEYEAQGFLETRQNTVQAVRNAVLVNEAITENRTLIQTNQRVVSDTGWSDPLAQTFLVDGYVDGAPTGGVSENVQGGGCFITGVDIFFATKDDSLPVTLQIREVVNGYPGRRTLAFGQAILPADKVKTSTNSSIATRFTFASPVYVQNATEYCIVLLSNSVNYRVWVSQLGQRDITSGKMIDSQPYAGVLFKSQNASTWTADQMQDLKFNVYRAKFVTGKIGRVEFENSIVTDVALEDDPIQFTEGSNKIRINMVNHGMTAGAYPSKVTLRVDKNPAAGNITIDQNSTSVSGVGTSFMSDLEEESAIYTADGRLIGIVSANPVSNTSLTLVSQCTFAYNGAWQYVNPVYGIKPVNLFKQHTVSSVEELDSFVVTLSESATQSGYGGGSGIRASRQIHYDAIQPFVTYQNFTNTKVAPYFVGISGKSINGDQIPYRKPDENGHAGYIPVTLNDTNYLSTPYMIASEENTASRPGDGSVIDLSMKSGQRNSAIIRTDIYSDVDTLSPVIDTRSVSAILISNKVNKPSASLNIDPIDNRQIITNASDISIKTQVVSCYRSNNLVVINTDIEHGFTVGQKVKVELVDNTDFNGMFTVVSSDATSFSYELVGSDFASSSSPDADTGYVYGGIITIGNTGDNRANAATLYSGQMVKITGVNIDGELVNDNSVEVLLSDVASDGTFIKTNNILIDGTGNISIVAYDRYFDEITPVGSSSYSKYVTKKIVLANPSSFLKIKYNASIPLPADVQVYYKLGLVGSYEDFSVVEYRKAEVEYQKSNDETFKEIEIDIPNLPQFNAVTVKLVFTSTDSSKVPQVKELRIIACA